MVTGKLLKVLDPETGTSAKGEWSKQGFIIETEGEYPKQIHISIWNNKIELSQFKEGDVLNVDVNISSREFNGKWYTEVQAWKIDKIGGVDKNEPELQPESNDSDGLSF